MRVQLVTLQELTAISDRVIRKQISIKKLKNKRIKTEIKLLFSDPKEFYTEQWLSSLDYKDNAAHINWLNQLINELNSLIKKEQNSIIM